MPGRLRDVPVPVRIVRSENDAWLARPTADRIRALVPHAELTFIRNAGHFAMEDAPDEVVNELLEFFGR